MTIWRKLKKRWHLPPNVSKLPHPRVLLLSRPDRLGDVVISTSCIQQLKHQLPDTDLHFLVNDRFSFMLEDHPALESCIPLKTNHSVDELTREFKRLNVDTIVHLNPSQLVETAALHSNVVNRIGYSRKHGERLTAWLPYEWKKTGYQHEAYFNFDLLEPFDVVPPGYLEPWVKIPDIDKCSAIDSLRKKPSVLIHLASYGKKPRVPPEFFAEIAKCLIENEKLQICLVGVDNDDPAIGAFLSKLGELKRGVLDLTGKTTVSILAALCKEAKLMISRDSGPAHLSAALGCPTLTFFINPTPLMSQQRWKPMGPYVSVYTKPIMYFPYEPPKRLARRTVKKFDAKEAYQEARELMKRKISTNQKS